MLEGARHAGDFGGPGAGFLRGLSPCGRHRRDIFDDGARCGEAEAEILRRRLEKVDRTGAFVEINVRRQHTRFEIGRYGIEVVGRGERPSRFAQPEEAVVAQVIVDIRDQDVEDDTSIEGVGVGLSLGAMLHKGVNDLRVTAALAVLGSHHRHGREERNSNGASAIEAPR